MSLEGGVDKGRAARHVRPPLSKRARGNARKRVTPIRSTHTTGSGGGWTSMGSISHVMGSSAPTQVFSDSGGHNPPTSPADRIYDLSSELGMLRTSSAEVVHTLRSMAQGDRELEESLRPLFVAVESGLAECHQADLEVGTLQRRSVDDEYISALQAIFGRSAAPRGTLGPLRAGSRGGCGSAGGRTTAAIERLDGFIAALHRDVAAAGMLADQGEHLRVIARWARLVRARTTAQRPLTMDAGRNEVASDGATLDGDVVSASRDGDAIDAPRSSLDGGSSGYWTLRVFRQSTSRADRFGESDADSLLRERDRSTRPGAGDSTRIPSARRIGSSGRGRAWGGCPIVAVHALRAVLPVVNRPPPAKAQAGSTVHGGVVMGNGASAPSCSTSSNAGGSWRFLYSWLIGSRRRDDGMADMARPETPSLPPTPPSPRTVLPRITVRVIYAGRVSDMATLARTEERALAAEEKVGSINSASTAAEAADNGVFPPPTRNGFKAGSVELVRSEVRVAVSRAGPEEASLRREADALGAEPGRESGLLSSTAVKLQIALQLRTRSPVAVSRLIHRGGHLLVEKPSVVEAALSSPPPRSVAAHISPSVPSSARASSAGTGNGSVGGRGNNEATLGTSFDADQYRSGGSDALGVEGREITGYGRGGGSSGICDEEVDDDVVPSGFTYAPEELLLPKRCDAGGDESELKIGTDHFLGVNVVLPPDQPLTSSDGARPRPRRRAGVNTPSHKRKLRDSAREVLGTNPDIGDSNGPGGGASHGNGHGEGLRNNSKKRPRPDDGISSDDHGLRQEGRAVGLNIGVDGNRSLQQYGDSGSSDQPVRERTLLDRSEGFGRAVDARGTNADRDEGHDGRESSREAKRRKRNAGGKASWGWGAFRPWRAEPSAFRNVSDTRLAPPSHGQQQQRQWVDRDVEEFLNHEHGKVVQPRQASVERYGSGTNSSGGDARVAPRLSIAARALGKGSADPGAALSGNRERPGRSGRRAPLIVTVVLAPHSAETLL